MSTLKPGKTSDAVRQLRDAAIKEMDATPEGVSKPDNVKFDYDHSATPEPEIQTQADFDAKSSLGRFGGVVSPHVGNGNGGVR